MAFKMKGSAFKLGNVATKSVLKHKMKKEKAAAEAHNENVDDPEHWTTMHTELEGIDPDKRGFDRKDVIEEETEEETKKETKKETTPTQMKSPLEHEGRIVYDEEGREKPPYNLGEEIGEIVGKQTPALPMKSPTKKLDWGRLGKGIVTGGLSEIF